MVYRVGSTTFREENMADDVTHVRRLCWKRSIWQSIMEKESPVNQSDYATKRYELSTNKDKIIRYLPSGSQIHERIGAEDQRQDIASHSLHLFSVTTKVNRYNEKYKMIYLPENVCNHLSLAVNDRLNFACFVEHDMIYVVLTKFRNNGIGCELCGSFHAVEKGTHHDGIHILFFCNSCSRDFLAPKDQLRKQNHRSSNPDRNILSPTRAFAGGTLRGKKVKAKFETWVKKYLKYDCNTIVVESAIREVEKSGWDLTFDDTILKVQSAHEGDGPWIDVCNAIDWNRVREDNDLLEHTFDSIDAALEAGVVSSHKIVRHISKRASGYIRSETRRAQMEYQERYSSSNQHQFFKTSAKNIIFQPEMHSPKSIASGSQLSTLRTLLNSRIRVEAKADRLLRVLNSLHNLIIPFRIRKAFFRTKFSAFRIWIDNAARHSFSYGRIWK